MPRLRIGSEQALLLETGVFIIAEDYMIKYFDTQQLPSFAQSPGEQEIFLAWRGIAARMVVGQDHRRGALLNGRLEKLARMDQ